MDSECDSKEAPIMKLSSKIMPAAAAITALSSLACCLPLSLSAAAGFAALGIALKPYRLALIAISIAFLAIGPISITCCII